MWKGEKKCTFKSVPLDTALTAPEELAQLKVVIALLISPINFSHCTKEQEHNGQSNLTLQRLNSFPCHTPGVCMLSLHVQHPFHPFTIHFCIFLKFKSFNLRTQKHFKNVRVKLYVHFIWNNATDNLDFLDFESEVRVHLSPIDHLIITGLCSD